MPEGDEWDSNDDLAQRRVLPDMAFFCFFSSSSLCLSVCRRRLSLRLCLLAAGGVSRGIFSVYTAIALPSCRRPTSFFVVVPILLCIINVIQCNCIQFNSISFIKNKKNSICFNFILFYFILFYFILFDFIWYNSMSFNLILLYLILFYFILFSLIQFDLI